jgi:hypothetical protein
MNDTFYDKIKLLAGKSAYVVIPEKLSKIGGYKPGMNVKVTIETIE